jgi:hypothetical protein
LHDCIIVKRDLNWKPSDEEGDLDGESDVDDCAGEPDSDEMDVTNREQVPGGEAMQID